MDYNEATGWVGMGCSTSRKSLSLSLCLRLNGCACVRER